MIETNIIKCMDCIDYLRTLPDCSVDLVVTSPPYNKEFYNKHRLPTKWDAFKTKVRAVNYEVYSDIMDPHDYYAWQRRVISECLRVLKPSGSLFYNHKDILCEKRSIPASFVWEFNVREVIVWNRSCTPTIDKSYFFPIHEYIYWITKGNKTKVKFDRNKVPLHYRKSILTIHRETDNEHPAPFPLELPSIFIEACTDVGDIILDPFMGSGTTALAAKLLGRNFIGCELNQRFINLAYNRLHHNYIEPYFFLL